MSKRTGFYCWAGPGTIRMTKLKFFNAKVDIPSLMHSYDYDYLARVQETFGITDVWATYSWGFSDKTEKEDRKFLIDRIENFHKLGLKLHAYIQGPTIVYDEFPNVDWYCKDNFGNFVTYHRGRRMVCVNNPAFEDYIVNKISKAAKHDFDGIYIDNVVMGQLPLPIFIDKMPFVFAGCNCNYCQKKFTQQYDENIPLDFQKDKQLTQKYLDFRSNSMTQFIASLSTMAHMSKKEFGTNSYDPKFNPKYMYGIDLPAINKLQDYLLFENYSFPNKAESITNKYIEKIANKLSKPIFVVSYKYGIGLDKEFNQEDFNLLYKDNYKSPIYLALKGSEFYTNGIWHNLHIDKYTKPFANKPFIHHLSTNIRSTKKFSFLKHNIIFVWLIKRYYNYLFRLIMENKIARGIESFIGKQTLYYHRNIYPVLKNNFRLILLALIMIGFVVLFRYLFQAGYYNTINQIISNNIFVAIPAILLIKLLGLVFPPLSSGIITLATIPAFGWAVAYILDFTGTFLGLASSYFIGRRWGKPILRFVFNKKQYKQIMHLHINPARQFYSLLLLSLIFANIMIEIVSYAAGALKLKFHHMLAATLLAHALWNLPLFYFFEQSITGSSIQLAVGGFVFLLTAILAWKLKQKLVS